MTSKDGETMEKEMSMKRQWNGTYRDVYYEIQNFDLRGHGDGWTFYLYIAIDQMPDDVAKRFWLRGKKDKSFNDRVFYDYYAEPLISDLEWHGGCTWYSKEGGFDGSKKIVRIGCDYQQSWDEGMRYSENILLSDAKRCIDSLWEKIPSMKRRCNYNGRYYPQDRGVSCADGTFLSDEGKRQMEAWERKRWKLVEALSEGKSV